MNIKYMELLIREVIVIYVLNLLILVLIRVDI